jgi:hypothetical protein
VSSTRVCVWGGEVYECVHAERQTRAQHIGAIERAREEKEGKEGDKRGREMQETHQKKAAMTFLVF